MSIGAHRDRDLSGPLVLHLVEGVLAEVERLNTKVAALEAELAQLRNRRSTAGEESLRRRFERFFHHYAPTAQD
jgi:hypothetical protein